MIEVPDYQIGQEVSIYFKDSMIKRGVVREFKDNTMETLQKIKDSCLNCESCTQDNCKYAKPGCVFDGVPEDWRLEKL